MMPGIGDTLRRVPSGHRSDASLHHHR